MNENQLKKYLEENGEIILSDSLSNQELINVENKTNRLYYLRWSPRENSGEPRQYVTSEYAIELIKEHRPELIF